MLRLFLKILFVNGLNVIASLIALYFYFGESIHGKAKVMYLLYAVGILNLGLVIPIIIQLYTKKISLGLALLSVFLVNCFEFRWSMMLIQLSCVAITNLFFEYKKEQ